MLVVSLFEGDCWDFQMVGEIYYCLNEMCIKLVSIDWMFMVIIEVEVDGELIDQYQCDGFLVVIFMGFICYIFFVNGFILYFGMDVIVIIFICFLSLFSCFIVIFFGFLVNIWFLGDFELNIKFWIDGFLVIGVWFG